MLTNVEKGYQLGLSDSILKNGAVPTVRIRADWKVWSISLVIRLLQFLIKYLELDSPTHHGEASNIELHPKVKRPYIPLNMESSRGVRARVQSVCSIWAQHCVHEAFRRR